MTTAQIVEWQPPKLPPTQRGAVDALVRFMLDINAQDFPAAWNASIGGHDGNSDSFSAFRIGYRTTRFYQIATGQPATLSSDLVAVPLRFVSRQNGAEQGNASIPSCVFWPQFVYLVGKRGGQWLPDVVNAYAKRAGVAALERAGSDGLMHLNPFAEESRC